MNYLNFFALFLVALPFVRDFRQFWLNKFSNDSLLAVLSHLRFHQTTHLWCLLSIYWAIKSSTWWLPLTIPLSFCVKSTSSVGRFSFAAGNCFRCQANRLCRYNIIYLLNNHSVDCCMKLERLFETAVFINCILLVLNELSLRTEQDLMPYRCPGESVNRILGLTIIIHIADQDTSTTSLDRTSRELCNWVHPKRYNPCPGDRLYKMYDIWETFFERCCHNL